MLHPLVAGTSTRRGEGATEMPAPTPLDFEKCWVFFEGGPFGVLGILISVSFFFHIFLGKVPPGKFWFTL